jgi:bla regulator protein BlaR1
MNAVITHLWQSTVFGGLVWLLTVALRNYRARTRFSVWTAASIKFLVPFALLTTFGSHWAVPNSRPLVHGTFYKVIEQINQPFASGLLRPPDPAVRVHSALDLSAALAAIWLCGCILILIRWARQWHRVSRLVKESAVLADGREVSALRQAEARAQFRRPIPIVATPKAPGRSLLNPARIASGVREEIQSRLTGFRHPAAS